MFSVCLVVIDTLTQIVMIAPVRLVIMKLRRRFALVVDMIARLV